MSVGDPLLAAIFAEPRVDEHRRVYADWLCERGDPRGEFNPNPAASRPARCASALRAVRI